MYLLVNIATLGSPSKDLIVTLGSVDSRLGVDGEVSGRVELDEAVLDSSRLQSQGLVTPGQGQGLAGTVLDEESTNVLQGAGRAPVLDCLVRGVLQVHTIAIQVSVGGRPRVSPASVRELVPGIRATDIRLGTVGPEDGADGLLLALLVEARSPWHVLLDVVGFVDQTSAFKNQASAALEVEGVVVDAANTALNQLQSHLDTNLHTKRANGLIIILLGEGMKLR